MTRNVGDTVFSRSGRPGVVFEKNAATGQLKVEREGELMAKAKKRGYINGLNHEQRQQYNEIRDEVLDLEQPNDKVRVLRAHLSDLKANPKNHQISRYVEADLAHTMITHGINPKTYITDEHNVR